MSYTTSMLAVDCSHQTSHQHQLSPQHYHHHLLHQPSPFTHESTQTASQYPTNNDYFQTLVHLQRRSTIQTDFAANTPQATFATPHSAPAIATAPTFEGVVRQDSAFAGFVPEWMYWAGTNSMGGPVNSSFSAGSQPALKRQRTHQRTPSASTIASNEPSSPFHQSTHFPQIANADSAYNTPTDFFEQTQNFSKNPSSVPQQFSINFSPSEVQFQNAHLAMKGFAIDHHHQSVDDFTPEIIHSSRQSMSSTGQNSPATPHSSSDNDVRDDSYRPPTNGYNQTNPASFLRTDTNAAYQDELYNPANFSAIPTSQAKPSRQYLSPHRNLVHDRLQTANLARSSSPTSAASRERSPFRQGSPLAPAMEGWNANASRPMMAAGMRQQQKEEATQAEYAQHRPSLQREPTKTISPKDAVLDYNGADEPSLFQDSVPNGYTQHFGGAESHPSNMFGQSQQIPNNVAQHMPNFRATHPDAFASSGFGFSSPHNAVSNAQQISSQAAGGPFAAQGYQSTNMNNMNSSSSYPATTLTEATPEFRPTLTSMESSMSDGGPGLSSQGSAIDMRPAPQRPSDTRANTGTYTCTYHGCAQRFDSHHNLQKHKRDFHRAQAQAQQQQQLQHESGSSHSNDDGTSSDDNSASASLRSTESPAPSSSGAAGGSSGMTSAAILARNSQAGPHKCTRINPSTGKPCNTIFSRPYDLTRHEDTIHNGRKHKVRCPMCREEKTFSRNDALTRHMRVVHPEVENFGKRRGRGD